MENKPQKKKKKKLGIIIGIIILIIIYAVIKSASNDPNVVVGKNSDTTASSSNNDSSNSDSQDTTTPTKRDNSSAKLTTLSTGNYTVGKEIPAGRYVMTPEGGSGNFVVENGGIPVVNEILGDSSMGGVPSVTATLKNGEQIQISGIPNVKFTPATTELKTTLTTGEWVVGEDIKAGRYKITPTSGSGNFVVENGGIPVVNEILGDSSMGGVPSITATLTNGEVIEISGLHSAKFTQV